MRLFVGNGLSDEMQKASIKILHDIKVNGVSGNYTSVQNMHMTLCFIGETTDVEPIKEAMKTVHYKPFKLNFTELGNFGDILYIGTRGGQGINGLAADIRKAFDNAGINYDKKKFTPHITLVRKAVGKPGKILIPDAEMMVKKVSLFRSDRVKNKQVYTEVFSI